MPFYFFAKNRCLVLSSGNFLFIEGRIESIKILGVKVILNDTQSLAETLEVNYFSFTQEFYRVTDVRVVCKTENVLIG